MSLKFPAWRKTLISGFSVAVGVAIMSVGCVIVPTDNLPQYVRAASMAERHDEWAKPVNLPGLPNAWRVDEHLYRGGEPARGGYDSLRRLGVVKVVNLRADRNHERAVRAAGMDYVHIRANVWNFKDEHIVQFLRAVGDRSRGPVFVHCQRGSDRTGAMVAIYRMVVNGWSADEAVAEMTAGGFGYDSSLDYLVEHLRRLDVERLARQAGLRQ